MPTESHASTNEAPLYSIYRSDALLADILPMFVRNMPRYTAGIRDRLVEQDWAGCAKICHDLKGTAGGYGYPQIGKLAEQLEQELKGSCNIARLEDYLLQTEKLCHLAALGIAPDDKHSSVGV